MATNEVHSTGSSGANESLTRRRRRWTWITIASVGVLSASALVAVPAIASDADPVAENGNDRVIVCESGVETNGDVKISAATATRLPAGDTTPVPEGCREE